MTTTAADANREARRGSNPYVGPRSFTEVDHDLFFGRDNEARDLLALVLADRLVVFYAQSGAGKTSLINARLIPALRERSFDILPVGRVGGKPSDVQPANVFTFNLLDRISAGNPELASRPNLQPELARLSLAMYFGASASPEGTAGPTGYQSMPTALIVDQFEELFTNEVEDPRARFAFLEQLREAQIAFPSLWVVLVMREEFVAQLDTVAHLMPNRLESRFYMQRMTPAAALDAIREPANARGIRFDDDAAQDLVKELSTIRVQSGGPGRTGSVPGRFIEPVQLQVVCYTLWENLPPTVSRINTKHVHQFGNVDQALSGFYERALAVTASTTGIGVGRMRDWFETRLITRGGTRAFVYRGPDDTGELSNRAVDLLEREHLVRAEPRAGAIWIELTHDRLIEPIKASDALWSRRRRTNQFRWGGALAAVAAIVVLAGAYLWISSNQEATSTYYASQAVATVVLAQSLATQAGATAMVAQNLASQADATSVVAQSLATQADAAAAGFQSQLSTQTVLRQQSVVAPTRTALAIRATDAALSTPSAASSATPTPVPTNTPVPESPTLVVPIVGSTLAPTAAGTPAPAATRVPSATPAPARTATLTAPVLTPGPTSIRPPTATAQVTVVAVAVPTLAIAWTPKFKFEASNTDAYWVDYNIPKQRAVTAGADGTVRLWDSLTRDTATEIWRTGRGAVYTATSSPDGARILIGGAGPQAEVWDVDKHARVLTLQGHANDVIASAWNQDGTRMMTGSFDLKAIVWDAVTGAMARQLAGHSDVVSSVAFAPHTTSDGHQIVATGSWDSTARLWDADTGAVLVTLPRDGATGPGGKVWSIAFTPDGRFVLTGSDDGYIRWWTLGGDLVREWPGHTAGVTSLTFSPNGQRLLSTSGDSTARVWDVSSGRSRELSDGTVLIWSGTFVDDARFLTGASDGNVRVWSTP